MRLKTIASPSPAGASRRRCSGAAGLLAAALAGTLAAAGCGGGQLAGQASQPATQAAPTATQTAPATTAHTTPARTTPRPATTTTPAPATTPSTTPATTAPPATTTTPSGPATHVVDEQAQLTLVQTLGDLHYIQRGHVSGTFEGEMTLETKPSARGGVVTFTLDVTGGGSVTGRGVVTPHLSVGGKLKPVTGSAMVTGGTGEYAGISGRGLVVSGKAALDGSQGQVRLTGVVRY